MKQKHLIKACGIFGAFLLCGVTGHTQTIARPEDLSKNCKLISFKNENTIRSIVSSSIKFLSDDLNYNVNNIELCEEELDYIIKGKPFFWVEFNDFGDTVFHYIKRDIELKNKLDTLKSDDIFIMATVVYIAYRSKIDVNELQRQESISESNRFAGYILSKVGRSKIEVEEMANRNFSFSQRTKIDEVDRDKLVEGWLYGRKLYFPK